MNRKKKKHLQRQFKFFLISRILIPIFIVLYKVWVKTLRFDMSCLPELEKMFSHEKIVYAVYHGNAPCLLAWSKTLRMFKRESVILTSPSRDGHIIDAVIKAFGQRVVKGSSSSGGKEGTLAMINQVKKGTIGIITVDGPRGPLGVPKPGFITVTRHSDAVIYTVVITASRFIQFGSWDKLFLPLPFARTSVKISRFDLSDEKEPREVTIHRLQAHLWNQGQAIDCPITRKMEPPKPLSEDTEQ